MTIARTPALRSPANAFTDHPSIQVFGARSRPFRALIPALEEYNQNRSRICECESVAHALGLLGVRIANNTPGGASPPSPITLARLVNSALGRIDLGGCRFVDVMSALETYGVDAYHSDECDDGEPVTMLTPMSADQHEFCYRHRYGLQVTPIDPRGPDAWEQIKEVLAEGFPIQAEFGVTPEFEALGVDEPATSAMLEGPAHAGHSVLILGYDMTLNQLFAFTSWSGFDRMSVDPDCEYYTDDRLLYGMFRVRREAVPAFWALRAIIGVRDLCPAEIEES